MSSKPTEKELEEEERRLVRLRRMVDLSLALIAQTDMPIEEADRIVAVAREMAERLFPGKGEVFDLVYAPRFRRLITERYRLH